MSESTKAHNVSEEVRTYVESVRRALADLAPEEVDDLTGGMEADLTELLRERGGSLSGALGTPQAYAVELRQAAGLPEPSGRSGPTTVDVGRWWKGRRAAFAAARARHEWMEDAWQFLGSLRPAWWVLRGYVAAWVLLGVFRIASEPSLLPNTPGMLIFGTLLAWVGVKVGRRVKPGSVAMGPLYLVNIVAVIALPFGLFTSEARSVYQEVTSSPAPAPPGLTLDGTEVMNVYGYGPDGQRLTGIRLFDDQGRPLKLGSTVNLVGGELPKAHDIYGNALDNVYPQTLDPSVGPWQVPDWANPASPSFRGRPIPSPAASVAPLATGTPTTTVTTVAPQPTGAPATTPSAPGSTSVPAPPTTSVSAPATTSVPAPATTSVPASATTSVPAPATTSVPAPATTSVPASATTSVPAPATTTVPPPPTGPSSALVVTTVSSSGVMLLGSRGRRFWRGVGRGTCG
jgi:hypothetical protein